MSEFSGWLISNHPRVKYLKKAHQCTEFRGGAPVKLYRNLNDEDLVEKWRCKVPAHWKFTALKRARFSKDGVMCLKHLYYRAVFGDMDETEATERLMVKTGYATPEQTWSQQS